MRNSILVLLFCMAFSSHANDFTYNQLLAEYRGGVIGSLNNCGVNLATNPRFLRGAGSVSLQAPGEEFLKITSLGERGVISITKSFNVYYSPDALNLSGGGSTVSLGGVLTGLPITYHPDIGLNINGRPLDTFSKRSINLFEVPAENIAIITISLDDLYTSIIKVDATNFSVIPSTPIKFLGYANNRIYSQYISGAIYSFSSTSDFLNNNNGEYIETSDKVIEGLKPFNGGLLTVADGILYHSTSTKLLSGSNVELMYPKMQEKITQMITIAGETSYIPISVGDITIIIPQEKNDQIVLALNDGSVVWGNKKVLSPIENEQYELELEYAYYLSENSWNPLTFDGFVFEVLNGRRELSTKVETTFLNYGENKEYGNGFHVGDSDITTSGSVIGFNGLPTTVRIDNEKTVNGWRNKGEKTGMFSHGYSDKYIGLGNKMRVVANHSCTIITAVTFKEKITDLEYEGSLSRLYGAFDFLYNFNLEDSLWMTFNASDYKKPVESSWDWKKFELIDIQKQLITAVTSNKYIVNSYLFTCELLGGAPGKVSSNPYYKIGCPASITGDDIFIKDDWGRGTTRTPEGVVEYGYKLVPQFKFVNGELVWTD